MAAFQRLVAAGLLVLGTACSPVDRLAPRLPETAPRLAGTSDQGFRKPDCPPITFDVAVDRSAITSVLRVSGRAGVEARTDRLWVDGSIDADDTVQVEVRSDRTPYRQVRLYQLWRGTRAADGSLMLREPEPSCGRAVVLAAK